MQISSINQNVKTLIKQIQVFDTLDKKELKKDLDKGLEISQIAEKHNVLINDTEEEKLNNILKDIPKDENFNVYEPNALQKAMQGLKQEGFLYASLQKELMNSQVLYGLKDDDFIAFRKLKALQNDTTSNNIYNQIFRQNNTDLKQLLKENEFIYLKVGNELDFVGLACGKDAYCDKLADLLAREDLSLDDFKNEFIKLANEMQNHFDEEVMKASKDKDDDFKPIESKSENIKESLNKIDINKIKNDRDLLAIFLAYKNEKNIYDRRV